MVRGGWAGRSSGWRSLDQHSKYGNTPMRCRQGTMHHSKLEARWCDDLHVLQAGGRLRDLQAHPQPKLDLTVNGTHITTYIPDFTWVDVDSGEKVIADAKGHKTREYEIKKRLVRALYGVEIEELGRTRGRWQR